MSEDDIINHLIELRALVGFLGEKHQANWWDTSFLNRIGQQYLTIAFPRSAFSAAVNCVTEAARRVHDEFIGKTGVYHLFRLPFALEERVHASLLGLDPSALVKNLETRQGALEVLGRLAEDVISSPEGAVQVGTAKRMLSSESIRELAKHYDDAFRSGKRVYPYFLGERQ